MVQSFENSQAPVMIAAVNRAHQGRMQRQYDWSDWFRKTEETFGMSLITQWRCENDCLRTVSDEKARILTAMKFLNSSQGQKCIINDRVLCWKTVIFQWNIYELPTAARLLRSWVRIPPGAWMFFCCECCVLSGRSLCDGSLLQSSPTDCGASLYVIKKPRKRGG
jgi:hypothetical protein